MPIAIHELRLSFIWMEGLPALLAPEPNRAPMAFLGRKETYKQEFDKVQAGTSTWTAPWPPAQGRHIHHFWRHYLGNKTPEQISSQHAWKHVVPLRKPVKVAVETPGLPGRLGMEGFYYPHGVALVATISLSVALSFSEMVDKAIEARTTGKYAVTWADGSTKSLSLDALADWLLNQLREIALGKGALQGDRTGKPFTIATVIRGAGIDATQPIAAQDAVHRALEGLCSWHQDWKTSTLHDLNPSTNLKIRHASPGHLLYGLERGRAVWFPDSFTKAGQVHSLSCYHRNLTLLSLQIESLAALLRAAAGYVDRDQPMPASLEDLAGYAAGIVGRLYGGTDDTYRSWSPRAHIDGSQYTVIINKIRALFNLGPLL